MRVRDRLEKWRKGELRGASQTNDDVLLIRYNEGLHEFQKALLEYVANKLHITTIYTNLREWVDTYSLPFGENNINDFYSITQLRVAYKENRYRVATQIENCDYNIRPNGRQKGQPYIKRRITCFTPKYSFVGHDQIRIFPTPKEDITNGLCLTFNYFLNDVELTTDEEDLKLPRYFLDVIDKYLSYKLIKAENIELAGQYYSEFKETLHNNIYGLYRDQRPIEEERADLSYFYCW